IRVVDDLSWTAPAVDFAMGAFYKLHLANLLPLASQAEGWFPYSEPADVRDHLRSFPGLKLRFAAPFFAFAFDGAYSDARPPGADPVLHAVHCERVRTMLHALARRARMSQRVRKVLTQRMRSAQTARAEDVARALDINHHTMARKLMLEGTSFQA